MSVKLSPTEQIIADYIKDQCCKEKVNNAIIILPETIDLEVLKINDTVDIQHYRQFKDNHNKIQCLHIKVNKRTENVPINLSDNYSR